MGWMADLVGFRPAAVNAHTVYQWWHVEAKGPEQTTDNVADYWNGAASRLGQHGDDIEKLMSEAGGHWEGAGADAMQAHLSPLAQWATAAQGVCGQMHGAMNHQGATWTEARPKIQQVDATPPDPGFSSLWPPNYADQCNDWRDKSRANMQAMATYGQQTQANLQNMPVFTAPQSSQGQLGVGTGPGPNVDYQSGNPGSVGNASYSGSRYSGSPSGPYNYQPGPGGPSQPVVPGPQPWQGPPPVVGPEPQPMPLPGPGGPIGTDPSHFNPSPTPNLPGFNDPGASGGQYGPGGSGGATGGFLGGGFGAGGGDFSAGGRAGGAGGRAGAGAGGFGAEDEFGSRAGRGMGAAGGRPGAPGQSGMGAGGRGGKGEEDKEHRSPSYLEEIEDVFGIGEKVAPPVIGEE